MRQLSTRRLVAVGLLVALFLGGVVSFYASRHPDGLSYVAHQVGFGATARPHLSDGSPFAGYSTKGISNHRLSGGIAGVLGVVVVGSLGGGLAWALRRRGSASTSTRGGVSVGAGHGHHLHYHGHSPIHRLPAQTKLVALVAFVVVVVATPRERFWAFATYAALLVAVVALTRVPPTYLVKRMVVEVPFVVFALLMPFIATGPRLMVGPLAVSQAGVWAAWGLLAKGTLGVVASLVLGMTTEPRDLLRGLERLHLPHQLVQIMGFMVRYLEVVTGELQRMRIARESRGFRARSLGSWPALASTIGALFIRSFERGERIHLAMLSRGYTGRLPDPGTAAGAPAGATATQWSQAGILPAVALVTLLVAVTR
ncbi:cobalt ECF transporter T component CbiQ [Nostocoides sp. HKS02]|uniref:cobalt ECF transporter T component CbiQ n=1 Tax=Nostocoides sp. HKS02 TaxID=1813880 RepID=UPI0012B4B08B|nr:cobalt ECF transporter T component CbiQ [Tetrasphaera sp. HKS02]QGN56845.1 cobalt ECF transporter T component CbiQ [Tetrasphaera sp. HKS02]